MNESKKCGPGSTKALHHIIRNTAFTRWQHRLTVFYIEQWLYEPFRTFETSAPKKNWSDWIWFESDLSDQIRSNISDLQFRFSSKKFWTDQISSDQFESDQNQISSNSIHSKLIWSDSSSSNFKLKIKKMRFIEYLSIQWS